ncbi:MAG: DUF3127 domain-containing protein [Candidatus Azobacteroides sp.]|nr:DUF3127 domain-containing protein [Candidatus Azobacteroides sp.]
MQITAKLIQILPLETGVGRNGEWKKQNIVVETEAQYARKICISIWGDKIPTQLQVGQLLTIDFDIESREFNGRWYTDIKAWKVETARSAQDPFASEPPPRYGMPEPPPEPPAPDFNDLPF